MTSVTCTRTNTGNVAQVSAVIAQANSKRLGFIIWNNGSNSAYLTFGPISSSSSPQVILASFATYTWPYDYSYYGQISAIRNAGTGTFTIAEFVLP